MDRASSGSGSLFVDGRALVELGPGAVEAEADAAGVGSLRGSGSGGGWVSCAEEPEDEAPDVLIASVSRCGSFRFLPAETVEVVPGRSFSFPGILFAVGG